MRGRGARGARVSARGGRPGGARAAARAHLVTIARRGEEEEERQLVQHAEEHERARLEQRERPEEHVIKPRLEHCPALLRQQPAARRVATEHALDACGGDTPVRRRARLQRARRRGLQHVEQPRGCARWRPRGGPRRAGRDARWVRAHQGPAGVATLESDVDPRRVGVRIRPRRRRCARATPTR